MAKCVCITLRVQSNNAMLAQAFNCPAVFLNAGVGGWKFCAR